MADLKKLQEMVKSGEFSKELMADEEFKSKLKKNLKEENGVEVTDDQIPEIIKDLEVGITGEQKVRELSEEELEQASGGGAGATLAKTGLGVVGFLAGYKIAAKATNVVSSKISDSYKKYIADGAHAKDFEKVGKLAGKFVGKHPKQAVGITAATLGGAHAGAVVGVKLANYICEKFDIE